MWFTNLCHSAHLVFQSLPANGCVHSEYEDEAVIWESRMSPVIIPKPRLQSVKEENNLLSKKISKEIVSVLLYFALWLAQKPCATRSTNQKQDWNQSRLGRPPFPALLTVCLVVSHQLSKGFSSSLVGRCDCFKTHVLVQEITFFLKSITKVLNFQGQQTKLKLSAEFPIRRLLR